MNRTSFFIDAPKTDSFMVYYPYYGLFSKADVTPVKENNETVFQCKLSNGQLLLVKKTRPVQKWIDANLNCETPLSSVIGTSIEDFLGK